jgi:hypothetical protein
MKAYRSVEAWLHSFAAMEVSGQLHAPAALTPGNTPVSNECDARLASDVQVDRRIRG